MIYVIIISCSVYVALGVIISRELAKSQKIRDEYSEPMVSVIVAVRDESDVLGGCLNSLVNLDYPVEKTEIIFIDDNSKDGSPDIIKTFSRDYRHIYMLELESDKKRLPGKAGAVQRGVEHSNGDVIFLTDADCRVPRSWIRSHLGHLDRDTGMVGGFTLLDEKGDDTGIYGKIQSVDWLFLLSVAYASAGLSKPLSWVGNNMAFRRQAYDNVGGYLSIKCGLVEDFALMTAIAQSQKWTVKFSAERQSTVISTPVIGLNNLYNQRKRWAIGIKYIRPFGIWLLLTSFFTHVLLIAGLFLERFWLWLACILVVFAIDFVIIYLSARNLGRKDLLRYFPGYEFYYFIYVSLLPFMLLIDKKIRWKGETYLTD